MRKILIALLVIFSLSITAYAHGGRTDSSGGHKDNKNASGLGSYHYHCGGYPAHLHTSGYCPYKDKFPTSVKLSAEKTTLMVGEEITITGKVSPSNACSTKVTWESNNTNIVSIKNGVATAIGAGTATITGTTFNGKEDQITIEVKEVIAERIEIKDARSLTVGQKATLGVLLYPENTTSQDITWSVSDEKIATIDKNGNITARAAGDVVVKATQKDVSAEITIQVVPKATEPIKDFASVSTNSSVKADVDDSEDDGASAFLGLAIVAGIAGIVISKKKRR